MLVPSDRYSTLACMPINTIMPAEGLIALYRGWTDITYTKWLQIRQILAMDRPPQVSSSSYTEFVTLSTNRLGWQRLFLRIPPQITTGPGLQLHVLGHFSPACSIQVVSRRVWLRETSLVPRLSVPDFVSQLWRKTKAAKNQSCGFCLAALEKNQSCETKPGTESLGTRLTRDYSTRVVTSNVLQPKDQFANCNNIHKVLPSCLWGLYTFNTSAWSSFWYNLSCTGDFIVKSHIKLSVRGGNV